MMKINYNVVIIIVWIYIFEENSRKGKLEENSVRNDNKLWNVLSKTTID